MTLKEMRERRATLVRQMRELHDASEAEDRALTDEEQANFDAAEKEASELTAAITAAESSAARGESIAAMERHLEAPAPSATRRVINAPADPAAREFESFGEFMHAAVYRQNDPRLEYQEQDVRGEQNMGDGPSGGFAIPTQFRGELLQVNPQASVVRSRAQVIPAGNPPDSAITMPALDQTGTTPDNVYGGVSVDWIGEGDPKPATDAKLRQITLNPHEVAAHVTLTDKLLRNWQASGPLIERLLRGAIFAAEDRAFLYGDGVGKPLGAANAGAAYAVNRATANQVNTADLEAMIARILMDGGAPVWVANRSVMPQLLSLEDAQGRRIWQKDLASGVVNQILGYPVIWNQRAPALGTKNDIGLFDFSQYLIKDGSGPFVAASEHVKFTSNKTVIKVFWNVDGAPWLTAPFKGEDGYDTSPFVTLDVPS